MLGRQWGDAIRLRNHFDDALCPTLHARARLCSRRVQTKASYLATFPSFIEWPETAFASEAPFLVCVIGDFRFGTALAELRGIHPLWPADRRSLGAQERGLKELSLLFVSNSEAKSYARILKIVQGAGILTVGETRIF